MLCGPCFKRAYLHYFSKLNLYVISEFATFGLKVVHIHVCVLTVDFPEDSLAYHRD